MKKNWKALLILGIILFAVILSAVISALSARIPHNDISVTGNTAGNLNNSGLFAESDGRVYFSNAYDSGCLYSMNTDETDLKKLSNSPVNSINVGGNYVYYFMNNSNGGTGLGYVIRTYGIFRSTIEGKQATCLDRNAAITMQLSGDYLYYQRYNNTDFTQLYKIKTDKTDNTLVYDGVINPASCYNGTIYFNGTESDHYLYTLNTATDSISAVYQGNLWYPVYQDGYVYYMDVGENYRLCRLSLSQNTVEVLTTDRADGFNVGTQYIYYQRNSATEPALMRMMLDGSSPEVVAEGNYSDINLTSTYAYFHAYGEDLPVYHTPVNGPVNVTPFTAAAEAASAN